MTHKRVVLFFLILSVVRGVTPGTRSVVVDGGGYFPVLTRLKTGEVMAVLRGGAPHVGRAGRLDLVSSRDGGKTWSGPRTLIDGPEDDRNPAFGQLTDGTLLAAFVLASGYDDSGTKFSPDRSKRTFDGVYVMRSRDSGKNWSKPKRSAAIYNFYAGKGAVSPFGKIVQLKDGTVLMTVYFEFFDGRGHESYLFRSTDGGKTWREPVLMGKHFNETALTVLPDGNLVAAMRSEAGGHLAITHSGDQGRTWSQPAVITKDREHPGDLIVLKNGALLLTYGVRNTPMGAHAMLSRDGGKTWDAEHKIILGDDAPNTDCGYPSSVEIEPGKILTLYYQVDDLKNAPQSAKAKAVIWNVAPR